MRPDDFRAYGTFDANHVAILRQDKHFLQTDRNELSLAPRHLGVTSGVSKKISEPMVRLAQTMHLFCTNIDLSPKRMK